jgi:hypothetical protein
MQLNDQLHAPAAVSPGTEPLAPTVHAAVVVTRKYLPAIKMFLYDEYLTEYRNEFPTPYKIPVV